MIKVLSCTDPEIEESLEVHEDLNVIVAIPRQQSNLRVDISEPVDEPLHMDAESSAQGASRNPPSGTTYDRPRPPRRHEASYQSGSVGGSYRSGTGKFKRYNVPEDYVS